MASMLWANVYYGDHFAGILSQEPGERSSFTYDPAYLAAGHPPIAYTLPLQPQAHLSQGVLPPFFDNLVAEGWMEHLQTRILGKRQASRFELILAFGYDVVGAVSIIDPTPSKRFELLLDSHDAKEIAFYNNRASLSGVQPKLAVIEKNGKFYPSTSRELSTHIAKFASKEHMDLLYNEFLTSLALQALLPEDGVVKLSICQVEGLSEEALVIRRFDRAEGKRVHFEEFNQLLGNLSSAKYDGDHKEMADFIQNTPGCIGAEKIHLLARIYAGLLLGNTDMHFKNFGMLHTQDGLRLAPAYDNVCAAIYDYKTVALAINHSHNLSIMSLNPNHLLALGKSFGVSNAMVELLVSSLGKNIGKAKNAIEKADKGSDKIKEQLLNNLEKRWNGTFAYTGQVLSKKQ